MKKEKIKKCKEMQFACTVYDMSNQKKQGDKNEQKRTSLKSKNKKKK